MIKELTKYLDKKFDSIDKKFSSVDKRFNSIEKSLDEKPSKKDVEKRFKTVDEQFETVEKRFKTVDERFKTVDEQFETVFSLLSEKPNKEDLETKADKKDIDKLLTAIDNYAAKADIYFQEMLMLSHKVDRLEKWILQLAEKAGVQLKA